jgi:hypothetical protein
MIGAVHGGVLCTCFSWAECIEAQDLDTAFFSERRTQIAILDDIGDRGERKAFLKMYKEHNATPRRSLAAKFPADYPASWLLAEVYEIASKACCDDLDDYQCALEMGDRSLRLLPEKPLLLIPLCDRDVFGREVISAAIATIRTCPARAKITLLSSSPQTRTRYACSVK